METDKEEWHQSSVVREGRTQVWLTTLLGISPAEAMLSTHNKKVDTLSMDLAVCLESCFNIYLSLSAVGYQWKVKKNTPAKSLSHQQWLSWTTSTKTRYYLNTHSVHVAYSLYCEGVFYTTNVWYLLFNHHMYIPLKHLFWALMKGFAHIRKAIQCHHIPSYKKYCRNSPELKR